MIIENPLLISLLIYVIICLVIYYCRPSFIFDNDEDADDKSSTKKNNLNIFKRNKNIIFIILPFVIYALVSIYASYNIRKNYCSFLKQKNLKIKDLIKKCKS